MRLQNGSLFVTEVRCYSRELTLIFCSLISFTPYVEHFIQKMGCSKEVGDVDVRKKGTVKVAIFVDFRSIYVDLHTK